MEEMNPFAEAPQETPTVDPGSVTVQDMDNLVKAIFDKRIEIETQEAVVTKLNNELAAMKQKAVLYLKALNREDYKSDFGRVGISQKWRVNMPQTDADKAALFDYLRSKGIFDKYATVNSNSLNSLYMSEWKAAIEDGCGMEFKMPGIGEPKLFEDLSMRKA